jgi:signal transduction histidine kinase
VAADPVVAERILAVLLDNLLRHGGGAGEVIVEADPHTVRLTFRNPGELPFARLADVGPFDHRSRGGLGVGLFVARRLSEANGLGLSVEGQNGVVTAVVTLPRA